VNDAARYCKKCGHPFSISQSTPEAKHAPVHTSVQSPVPSTQATPKDCPKCGLADPAETLRCDCGYDFVSRPMKPLYKNTEKPQAVTAASLSRNKGMSLFNGFVYCFKNYAVFKGRARRREYWGFVLFCMIVYFTLKMLDQSAGYYQFGLSFVWELVIIIPILAVTWRRLHDTGKSGTWALAPAAGILLATTEAIVLTPENSGPLLPTRVLLFIAATLVISFIYIIWTIKDSAPGDNKYGPNPKGL